MVMRAGVIMFFFSFSAIFLGSSWHEEFLGNTNESFQDCDVLYTNYVIKDTRRQCFLWLVEFLKTNVNYKKVETKRNDSLQLEN